MHDLMIRYAADPIDGYVRELAKTPVTVRDRSRQSPASTDGARDCGLTTWAWPRSHSMTAALDPVCGRCGVRREALRCIPGVAGMDWRDVLGSDVLPGTERLREKEHDRKLAAGSRYQGRCVRGPARYGES